jgi:hypothetical protein
MGVNIKGGNNSSGLANVSATNELQVVTPQTEENAGFVQVSAEVDSGDVLGYRTTLPLEISDDYRVRVGLDQAMFNTAFEGTNVNTGVFQQILATATVTQLGGFMIVNGGSSSTSGQGNYIRTYRHFPTYGTYPTYVDMWIREVGHASVNVVSEWGLLYLTAVATATPLDGVFFRRLSGGGLRAVINYNSTETEYTIDTTNIPARDGVGVYDPTEVSHYLIAYHNDVIRFWINDVLVASVDCPGNQQGFSNSSNLPLGFRVINTNNVTPAARQLQIGFVNVSMGDQDTNKPWPHVLCGMGQGAYQTQMGTATAQTANWANSAAPVSITAPSNTAVGGAGQGYSTLGGQYALASSVTNETDWIIFGYSNPAGTAALAGKTLYVTGIRISKMCVTGAAAVNATMFFWSAGVGSSNISLGTTDSTTASSPKRIPLGVQSFLAAAPIGTASDGFDIDFDNAPLVVPAGTFFHIIVKQLNGAATASLVWRGQVTVMGYFE